MTSIIGVTLISAVVVPNRLSGIVPRIVASRVLVSVRFPRNVPAPAFLTATLLKLFYSSFQSTSRIFR
jgi:hypothetical protein